MRIITLVTQKGGAGKTTLATSLGVAAAEAGEKVLMLDLDYRQKTLLNWSQERKAANPHVEQFPSASIAKLPEALKGLKDRFTTVFIDTAGEDSAITHWAMEAATFCLVPLRPSKPDVDAMVPTVQAILRGGTPFAFVLNQCPVQPNNPRAHETAAGLKAIGFLALPMIIQRVDFQDAYASSKGVTEFAPEGKGAEAMRDLWKWIEERTNER